MSTDKEQATQLADTLEKLCVEADLPPDGNTRKVITLLRRWPDGEPVMCPGRPDSRCNYDAHCGRVCNKCGRIHDGYANPNGTITSRGHTAPPAEPDGEPVAWREHVEQRLRSWRQSQMNRSGDRLALDDFMGEADIEDLIDWVCDEYAAPPAERIAALESAREVQDAALAVARNDFRELALRAEKLEAALAERDRVIEQMKVEMREMKSGYDVMGLAEEQRQSSGPFGGTGTPNAALRAIEEVRRG